ncbi:MAG TPA: hypothetical protein VLD37_00180 [Candidatus Bilamarchaeum sp.]|nr:hypothetical protein [Candidatus Bilamarchaeum sp.]
MFLLVVSPGYKPPSPDTALLNQKATIDAQAANLTSGNPAPWSAVTFPHIERMRLAEAARDGDRAAFNGILNNLMPNMPAVQRDNLYTAVRGTVLAEQHALYMDEYVSAVSSGDSYAARFWMGHVMKSARDQVGFAFIGGLPATAEDMMRQTLVSIGGRLSNDAQREQLLLDAIDTGASSSSVFFAARDMKIDVKASPQGGNITVMERLMRAAYARAETLFNDMGRLHGFPPSSPQEVEYNIKLHEFRGLLGANAIPDQAIVTAGDTERRAFLDSIYSQLKAAAGVP